MGSGLIPPGTLLLVVLLGLCSVRGRGGKIPPPPAAHFLYQWKPECHYANGRRGEVWLLSRHIYGREEFVRLDTRRGWFEALTPLGEPTARYWSSHEDWMDYVRAELNYYCRRRYYWDAERRLGIVTRKVQPTVNISHTRAGPLARHSLLLCTATGYYPSGVRFRWLKNGQEQTEGAGYADELQNGDWTYQNQAMLETVPEWEDVYACQVEHSSLKEPMTMQWVPRMPDSAKHKMWTGGVGALLGVVFGAVALSLYLKNRKVAPTAPAGADDALFEMLLKYFAPVEEAHNISGLGLSVSPNGSRLKWRKPLANEMFTPFYCVL
ncbi:UNVERIFIED_CONTAM: hypothetical protein K2H54_066416 [Gekko kuhli]